MPYRTLRIADLLTGRSVNWPVSVSLLTNLIKPGQSISYEIKPHGLPARNRPAFHLAADVVPDYER
jgi:hypothetical protein